MTSRTASTQPGAPSAEPIVLAAVDFSEDSRAALLWASRYAECVEGRLVVLHVVHDPAGEPGYYRDREEDVLKPMRLVAEEKLQQFLTQLRSDHPQNPALQTAEPRLVTGLPAGRIVELAEALPATLIVVGSRGMTGLPHLLLGSVSERVAQLSPLPVTVVKSPHKAGENRNTREKQEGGSERSLNAADHGGDG